jgi:hypothetical protein
MPSIAGYTYGTRARGKQEKSQSSWCYMAASLVRVHAPSFLYWKLLHEIKTPGFFFNVNKGKSACHMFWRVFIQYVTFFHALLEMMCVENLHRRWPCYDRACPCNKWTWIRWHTRCLKRCATSLFFSRSTAATVVSPLRSEARLLQIGSISCKAYAYCMKSDIYMLCGTLSMICHIGLLKILPCNGRTRACRTGRTWNPFANGLQNSGLWVPRLCHVSDREVYTKRAQFRASS